ncbi:hypothetical protein W97_03486 [Coniosporium apollinis CBS 100218]|uniref:CCHC-type domain-containing protein n=1 Tax=Coniosporium apollinis (strain CBS 100218) TaxID=1168221 RepID=R7YQQ6_CONA1|nr:uncharacterized protein W97_03486 [Coniosporium apollinis CBS 100218]EON64255.1 hypothetical protein W97_03486 [Coniosporium apollinis CBS 100218]
MPVKVLERISPWLEALPTGKDTNNRFKIWRAFDDTFQAAVDTLVLALDEGDNTSRLDAFLEAWEHANTVKGGTGVGVWPKRPSRGYGRARTRQAKARQARRSHKNKQYRGSYLCLEVFPEYLDKQAQGEEISKEQRTCGVAALVNLRKKAKIAHEGGEASTPLEDKQSARDEDEVMADTLAEVEGDEEMADEQPGFSLVVAPKGLLYQWKETIEGIREEGHEMRAFILDDSSLTAHSGLRLMHSEITWCHAFCMSRLPFRRCYNCGGYDHLRADCPSPQRHYSRPSQPRSSEGSQAYTAYNTEALGRAFGSFLNT